ncbi:Set1/Ash2 histone methyltransferase complex subunit ASH2 [Papilio machaon]|uniref:Set1/Ash2 histone methyltransferase complex subunit ASH2 n=1 Tax=Papilio machaon TaxID=76193 RepID=A0A194QR32_PAPMA|nr:Set1/Ash2 histone methyltransferase complex subunit ASH2 [Papilio machaon]
MATAGCAAIARRPATLDFRSPRRTRAPYSLPGDHTDALPPRFLHRLLPYTTLNFMAVPLAGNVKGRQGKRRPAVGGLETGAPVGKKGRASDLSALKLPSHGYPTEHPFNKDGYRYILAEPDPQAPFRQEFDENNEWSGKPIPGWLYRALCPGAVLLALHDRAPQLRLSEDRLAVTGDKGYCMVRATHGMYVLQHLDKNEWNSKRNERKCKNDRVSIPLTRTATGTSSLNPTPKRRLDRCEFDENNEWSAASRPGWLYRALCPGAVLLALHDRAPQLRLSEDRLAVTGDKGYCMVRATHGVSRGAWYWEAVVEELPEGAAARLGWGRRYANLQAPLGYDKFGYSWRSRKGTRYIHTTDKTSKLKKKKRSTEPLVKFKSHLYYEDKDNIQESLNNLKPLSGSRILFFKNGECQGEAFTDIYQGCYYPTVSLHKNITVSVNFGPNFKFPPATEYNYRPMSEKAEEAICEQTMADLLYLTENEGKLRLDNFNL